MVENDAHLSGFQRDKPRVLLVFRRFTSSFLGYSWMLARDSELTIDAISLNDHLIKHSVWINRHIKVAQTEEFLDTLCATLAEGDYDDMLCVDEPARTLVLNASDRPELQGYHPFKGDATLSAAAINKVAFGRWCETIGLSIPYSIHCESTSAVREAAVEMGYPFVLKNPEGSGGQQVFIVADQAMLEATFSKNATVQEWLVQEYLPGVVGTSMFVARGGRLYSHCSVENIACTTGGVGPTAVCRYVDTPELNEIVSQVAERIDGITGFDWILRDDGSYVLIDPHFGRVAPTGVCSHLFGKDFGAAYSASLTGTAFHSPGHRSCGVVWVFPQFLQLVFRGGLRAAWKRASPFSKDVKVYWCGRGEWRMFSLQFLYYLWGHFQVFAGKWRRFLTGNGKRLSGD